MRSVLIGAYVDTELGIKSGAQSEKDGHWYNARPIPVHGFTYRFRLAWAVFTGKADALFWAIDL